ncbi:MAG: hypothetical protein BWY78_00712 [Alphaproteobacteria bacterium ADurb.Bin438]|nr:MAG: hypothetical protein BWY78_00712 [Alphaproteobacteria bacterium ADurb.Bin438]
MKKVFLLSCLVSILSMNISAKDNDYDLSKGYLGNFGKLKTEKRAGYMNKSDEITRSKAEEIVMKRFDEILKNTSRKAKIIKGKDDNIIIVEITELDGSPFYKVNIDRSTGLTVSDAEVERRKVKIEAELKEKQKIIDQNEQSRNKIISQIDSSNSDEKVISKPLINNKSLEDKKEVKKSPKRLIFNR